MQALVGLLKSLEDEEGNKLRCGSHVDRLLLKLPPSYHDAFVEHCLHHGILQNGSGATVITVNERER